MNRRRNGVVFFLLSGFLFVCLACLELPGMSRLADDASNDYTNLTTLRSTSAVAAAFQVAENDGSLGPFAERQEGSPRSLVRPIERFPSCDRLALQSTWRT
jgi:hypothetical protein